VSNAHFGCGGYTLAERDVQSHFSLEYTGLCHDIGSMVTEKIPALKDLSQEEKLILVKELWDDLAAQPHAFPPREDHVRILKERLEHFRTHPADVVAWEDVKSQILGSR
jgi:putative addiction module component (TIGR02574 family)